MLRSSQALFASLPEHGRKRRYLAQIRDELCTGSHHLADNAHEVPGPWWVDTHASRVRIETHIRVACEVVGVTYGKDLIIDLK